MNSETPEMTPKRVNNSSDLEIKIGDLELEGIIDTSSPIPERKDESSPMVTYDSPISSSSKKFKKLHPIPLSPEPKFSRKH